jgi:hypothetical protein
MNSEKPRHLRVEDFQPTLRQRLRADIAAHGIEWSVLLVIGLIVMGAIVL